MTKIDLHSKPSPEQKLVIDIVDSITPFAAFRSYFKSLFGTEVVDVDTVMRDSLMESLSRFLVEMRTRDAQMRAELEAGRLTPEETLWTIRQVAESMALTPSEEKRKMLSQVAVGGLAQADRDGELHKILMKAMVQIDAGHIALLREFVKLPEDGIGIEDAFFDVFVPAVVEISDSTIIRSYWSEMVSLNLVRMLRTAPEDWVEAEFGTAIEELSRLRATDLGLALLDLLREDSATATEK